MLRLNSTILFIYYIFITCVDAPRITLAPQDQRVTDSSVVSFFCKALGNPAPDVYWRRAGKRIMGNRHRYFVMNMPHGSVLRIDQAKAKKDDGVIECVAENQVGDPAVATASLSVYAEGLGMYNITL